MSRSEFTIDFTLETSRVCSCSFGKFHSKGSKLSKSNWSIRLRELRKPVTQRVHVQQIKNDFKSFMKLPRLESRNFLCIFSRPRQKGRNLFPLRSQSRVGRFWHSANGHIGSELRNLIIIQAVEEGRANKAQSESLNPMRDDSAPSRWSRPTV